MLAIRFERDAQWGEDAEQTFGRPSRRIEGPRQRFASCHDEPADTHPFIADMKAAGAGGELGDFLPGLSRKRSGAAASASGPSVRFNLTVRYFLT
jgi:hypothetical protein